MSDTVSMAQDHWSHLCSPTHVKVISTIARFFKLEKFEMFEPLRIKYFCFVSPCFLIFLFSPYQWSICIVEQILNRAPVLVVGQGNFLWENGHRIHIPTQQASHQEEDEEVVQNQPHLDQDKKSENSEARASEKEKEFCGNDVCGKLGFLHHCTLLPTGASLILVWRSLFSPLFSLMVPVCSFLLSFLAFFTAFLWWFQFAAEMQKA